MQLAVIGIAVFLAGAYCGALVIDACYRRADCGEKSSSRECGMVRGVGSAGIVPCVAD